MIPSKKFISGSSIGEAESERLASDPDWYQDEFGFYLCYSDDELKKMTDRELTHVIHMGNPKDADLARDEQARRLVIVEHKLNLRDNTIVAVISIILTLIVEHCLIGFLGQRQDLSQRTRDEVTETATKSATDRPRK